MKRLHIISIVIGMLMLAGPATADEVNLYAVEGPQDPIGVNIFNDPRYIEHEIGDNFVPNQLISSYIVDGRSELTACFDGSDNPQILNVVVGITNLTNKTVPVWYVTDPQTTITNFDGYIGNAVATDAQEAFRIDSVGINQPLIFESLGANNLFEPGETWHFIIQDFVALPGFVGPAAPFDSFGVASHSTPFPPSTASLVTPEPATMGLLALGGLAVLRRRKR